MKKIVVIVVIILVLAITFLFRWQLDVGSDCTIVPDIEHSKVLYAQTPGVLTEFDYRSGDVVKEGQVLGKLVNIELQDNLEQVQASLKETLAQQMVLKSQLRERQQEVVSANLRQQKIASEYNIKNKDYRKYRKGDLPPELDILRIALEDSEREFKRLNREYKSVKKGMYPPGIEARAQQVEYARVKAENSQSNYDKNRYLFNVGAISRLDYENSEASYQMDKTSLNNNKASLADAIEKHRLEMLEAKETYLQTKEEFLKQLRDYKLDHSNLGFDARIASSQASQAFYTSETNAAQIMENTEKVDALRQKQKIILDKEGKLTLKAPLSGILIEENITDKIGKHFQLGEEVCQVAGLEKVLVNILVDEKDISEIQLNNSVRLKVKPLLGALFKGEVRKISPVSKFDENKKRNFYNVELIIDNPEGKLKPGMTGFAKINCGSRPIFILVLREIGHLVRSEYWFF